MGLEGGFRGFGGLGAGIVKFQLCEVGVVIERAIMMLF